VLTGSGDPNAVVTLTEGSTTLGTAMATDSGTWTFAPKGLADGPHTLVASETDAAGNTGSVSITFTLDTAPPALTPIANQIDQPTNQNGAMATFAATATDIVDGIKPSISSFIFLLTRESRLILTLHERRRCSQAGSCDAGSDARSRSA
jgi:hypothetical protein